MIWFNDWELSEWAYMYCMYVNNDSEVRKLITYSEWAYKYCRDSKDDIEVRKRITDGYWKEEYEKFIKR